MMQDHSFYSIDNLIFSLRAQGAPEKVVAILEREVAHSGHLPVDAYDSYIGDSLSWFFEGAERIAVLGGWSVWRQRVEDTDEWGQPTGQWFRRLYFVRPSYEDEAAETAALENAAAQCPDFLAKTYIDLLVSARIIGKSLLRGEKEWFRRGGRSVGGHRFTRFRVDFIDPELSVAEAADLWIDIIREVGLPLELNIDPTIWKLACELHQRLYERKRGHCVLIEDEDSLSFWKGQKVVAHVSGGYGFL